MNFICLDESHRAFAVHDRLAMGWPWAEAFHFIGMSLLFAPFLVMDVRLMAFSVNTFRCMQCMRSRPGLGRFLINLITA